jgi:phytoene/squalene synthetase
MNDSDYALLRDTVRTSDYDRFLALHLAARAAQPALLALTAFAVEVAHIADVVSEPLVGQMRLAWWRESLEGVAAGQTPRPHPVILALVPVIQQYPQLPALLLGYLESRAADLDSSLLAEEAGWRAYLDHTAGNLHLAWATVLDAQAAEAHMATIRTQAQAYAMLGLLRALPFFAAQGWQRFPETRPQADMPALVREVKGEALALLAANKAKFPASLRPLMALTRLARFHAKRLSKAGDDPTRLTPAKFGAAWCVFCT